MDYLKPQSPLKRGANYFYPLTTFDQIVVEDNKLDNHIIVETNPLPYILLESEWVNKNNKYLQIINVNGLTDYYNANVKLTYTDDYETNLQIEKFAKYINYAKQEDGKIIFYCLKKKPIVDIPIEVEVYV